MFTTKLRRMAWSGFLNFCRSPIVSLASVIALTVTLFVIGALLLSNAFFYSAIADIQNKVDISVSFHQGASEARILQLKDSLELLPEVRSVVYKSPDEELADFRLRSADNQLQLELLDELGNPFGARLNILAVDPSRYESIRNFLDREDASVGGALIDKISFDRDRDIVDRLVSLVSTAKRVGFVVALTLIFLSFVVTFNTVSLAIYASREEISLMQLVGANPNYIRGPFIIEGTIAGVISALLALLMLYPATIWLRNLTSSVRGGFDLVSYFSSHFALLLGLLLVTGVILGILSSYMATRRYLKL